MGIKHGAASASLIVQHKAGQRPSCTSYTVSHSHTSNPLIPAGSMLSTS